MAEQIEGKINLNHVKRLLEHRLDESSYLSKDLKRYILNCVSILMYNIEELHKRQR